MKYFSMFSGIGGFERGIERAFCDKQSTQVKQDREGWNGNSDKTGRNVLPSSGSAAFCVGFSEIDRYATAIYQFHYPEHRAFGDAFKIDPGTLPDFDLLCGGFPCQAFSIAGKRGGFEDTRGTLFFEIARIVAVKRPAFLLLENVKGLLSHDNGRTFGTIHTTLSDLGYFLEWQVLNSKDFGVPQNRERVFIVGHLGGIGGGQVFPIQEIGGLSLSGGETYAIQQLNNPTHSNDRIYAEKGLSPALNTAQGGNRQPKIKRAPLRFLDRNQKNIEGDYAFTVDSSNTSGVSVDSRIRRLTPVECERLQAFPDGWTKFGKFGDLVKEISDSQRYKCIGNSVTTSVIEAVIRKMINSQREEG